MSGKTRLVLLGLAVAAIIVTIFLNAGCGDGNEAPVDDQASLFQENLEIDSSPGEATAMVRKYFDTYLSGDCASAIEMFDWPDSLTGSDMNPIEVQWKKDMMQGCDEKHAMLESYEVVSGKTVGPSGTVITRLKGIENGVLMDENIYIPVSKENGEWKMGLWMTWPFRPDSGMPYTHVPGGPAAPGTPPGVTVPLGVTVP